MLQRFDLNLIVESSDKAITGSFWGYSFRLGNTRAWFKSDAEDATEWLLQHGLIDSAGSPTFTLRGGV
jgi:hypothetical protein